VDSTATVERATRHLQGALDIAMHAEPAKAAQVVLDALLSALPHASAGALFLMHPQTGLFWTGAVAALPEDACHPYFEAELCQESDSMHRLAATDSPSRARVRQGTGSRIGEVVRDAGFRDEIRVICSDSGVAWGGATLWSRDAEFTRADERWLDAVAGAIGRTLRDSVLASFEVTTPPGARGLIVLDHGDVIESGGIGRDLTEAASDRYKHLFHLRALAAADPRFSTVMRADDGSWISANGTDMGNGRVGVLLAAVTPAELLGAKVAAAGLTEREVEVTRLVCRGLTDAEIAAELYLSPHTVHDHVRAIRRKLDVRSRAGVASRVFSDAYFDVLLAGAVVTHGPPA
jgi:DNA-binding CsgD family transcriptional regulator